MMRALRFAFAHRGLASTTLFAVVAAAITGCVAGCAAPASRAAARAGDMARPAMSVTFDRDDITTLVGDSLKSLEDSAFWRSSVHGALRQPIVAVWPIRNATARHLDDEMLTSSLETSLADTGSVIVVDRSRQHQVAGEIGIPLEAAFDPAGAQRLGRRLGAKYFFIGRITSADEPRSKTPRVQYSLFLQVIDVETGAARFQNKVTRAKAPKG